MRKRLLRVVRGFPTPQPEPPKEVTLAEVAIWGGGFLFLAGAVVGFLVGIRS